MAVLDDFRSLEMIHNGNRETIRSRLRQDKGHQGEWEAFARAVEQGGPPPIPYNQLFDGMRAVFAARDALSSGKQVAVTWADNDG